MKKGSNTEIIEREWSITSSVGTMVMIRSEKGPEILEEGRNVLIEDDEKYYYHGIEINKNEDGFWVNESGDTYPVWEYEYYYDVYFKPTDGSTVENYVRNEEVRTVYDSTGYQNSHREYTDNYERKGTNLSSGSLRTPYDTDDEELWGLIRVGEKEKRSKKTPEELDPCDNVIHEFHTYSMEISGKSNDFDLKTFGADVKGQIHYVKFRYLNTENSYDVFNGNEDVLIWGQTSEEHTYTNLLLLDDNEKYYHYKQFNTGDWTSWNGKSYMYISGTWNDYDNNQFWTPIQKKTKYRCETGFTTKNVYIKYTHFGNLNMGEQENGLVLYEREKPIKKIIMYVDSWFSVSFPYTRLTRLQSEQDKKEYNSNFISEVKTMGKYGRLTTTNIAYSVYASCMNYSNHPDHKTIWDIFEVKDLVSYSGFNQSEEIDEEHARLSCSIIYVEKTSKTPIKNCISVSSPFIRFTDFWNIVIDNSSNKVMKGSDLAKDTPCGNQIWHPIYKPWAECDLLFLADNDRAFSVDCYRNLTRNLIKENYTIDGKKYSQQYTINISTNETTQNSIFANYMRTISPFRYEMWCTHGGRREYDEIHSLADKTLGKTFLLRWRDPQNPLNATNFEQEYFNYIHRVMLKWNSKVKLVYYSECCFGGGMGNGVHRNMSGNLLVKNPSDVIPGISDMWWFVQSCASHFGTIAGLEEEFISIYQGIKNPPANQQNQNPGNNQVVSYKELSDKFNNLTEGLRAKTFALIHEFFTVDNNANKDLIRSLLSDEQREAWDYSINTILNDLANKGRTYFCMKDWNVISLSAVASDNFFDRTGKNYKINDGIIGLLKSKLFPFSIDKFHEVEIFKKDAYTYKYEKPQNANASITMGELITLINRYPRSINDLIDVFRSDLTQVIDQSDTIWNVIRKTQSKLSIWDIKRKLRLNLNELSKATGISEENLRADEARQIDHQLECRRIMIKLTDIGTKIKEFYSRGTKLKTDCVVFDPIIGYSGKFARTDAQFMRNPDNEENEWLTSDNDLETLRTNSME